MNCSSCGANLPPGAAACPVCGTPSPYNVQRSGSSPQYDPTVVAPPYGSGNPLYSDPTEAVPRYDYGAGRTPPAPATGYGAPRYGTPSQNQYDPANAYGSAGQQYSYGAPPPPNSYGAPPQQGGYGQPGYLPPGQGAYSGMQGIQAPPPRPRRRVGLIIGIVVGVLALLCIGGCAILYAAGRGSVNTASATATAVTATATVSSNVTPPVGGGAPPSGLSIDPAAASIIKNVQMASEVDTNNATPTKLASTFTVQQTVYATVELNLNGQTGYTQAKWYGNGSLAHTSKVLEINKPDFTNAFFSFAYNGPLQGTVEIYWCTQKDCSDAKLAQVANFTVTSTSMRSIGQPVAVLTDMNNK